MNSHRVPQSDNAAPAADADAANRFERAIALKSEGLYSDALQCLRALAQETPGDAELHHQIGLILGFSGEFEGSLAELRHSVELSPSNTLVRNDLALTYTMLGMYDEARVEFANVLEHDRENQVAIRNLQYFH